MSGISRLLASGEGAGTVFVGMGAVTVPLVPFGVEEAFRATDMMLLYD